MQCHCVASKPQRILLFFLVWTASISCGHQADRTLLPLVASVHVNPSVCPYRTVNYITESLPQRCLTTSRPAPTSTAKIEAPSSSETDKQTSTALTSTIDSTAPHTSLMQAVDEALLDTEVTVVVKSISEPDEESEAESPLGKDRFLSFEEWKKQNLGKYGQSPDQIGKPKSHDSLQNRRLPINVLDSLGDDAEIELDFTAFASEKPKVAMPIHKDVQASEARDLDQGGDVPRMESRSKDAGTTFKERFNYASFDCAATILKTNAKSSGSSAILVENKDSYMLNECSVENKFIILELCEDILIDTIVLANFEFFSSIFRTFRVSVSDRYPVKPEKWKVLGTFEARNTREVQPFLVENPLIWTKYVQFEFLTYYGNEFYCPLSLVRVHGTTMLEDYRHDEDPSKTEDRDDEGDQAAEVSEVAHTETVIPELTAENLAEEESSKIAAQRGEYPIANMSTGTAEQPSDETSSLPHPEKKSSNTLPAEYQSLSPQNTNSTLFSLLQKQCLADGYGVDYSPVRPTTHGSGHLGTTNTSLPSHWTRPTDDIADRPQMRSSASPARSNADRYSSNSVNDVPSEDTSTTKQHVDPSDSRSKIAQSSDSSRQPASSTQPPPSNPTIQESFFKSVQKRLQMLESNSTLSLQYIEEQSRILRDAFSKVEQRQLSKTTKFLDYLNSTVVHELRDFTQQYDQLWQSTVSELETQREQSRREVITINTQLSILGDELVFQKRIAVLQTILVLICIGLVLFSRGTVTGYLEHPLLQNMLARSATLKMRGSLFDTPSMSPESTRPNSSYKAPAKAPYSILKAHRRTLSEDSQDGADNPAIAYSPPTPASYDDQSEIEDRENELVSQGSLARTLTKMQRSSSSPPNLRHSLSDPDTPTQRMALKNGEYAPSLSQDGNVYSPNDASQTVNKRRAATMPNPDQHI